MGSYHNTKLENASETGVETTTLQLLLRDLQRSIPEKPLAVSYITELATEIWRNANELLLQQDHDVDIIMTLN